MVSSSETSNSTLGAPLVAKVLPGESGIVTCDSHGCNDSLLLSAESAVAQTFSSQKRRREFELGRRCARQALAALGIGDFPLLPGPDRAPVWPEGIVGSITHTEVAGDSYCAVAVAPRRDFIGVGIDAELRSGLSEDLWNRVLDRDERAAALASSDPGTYACLVFSAKEAVYKALYPLFKRFLDFPDVHVDCAIVDRRFAAELRGDARGLPVPPRNLLGQFVIEQSMLMTGIALTAGSLQLAHPTSTPQHGPS